MAGLNKIESYLIDLGIAYEEIGTTTWLVEDEGKGLPPIVIAIAEPVVVIRATVMQVPATNREAFYRELLTLNGAQILHGAYAIEGEKVVLIDTLVYDTLDKAELEATIDAIGFALSEHYHVLSSLSAK